ncbi:putative RNA methyltransferase TrmH, group 1 [Thiomonas sp. X19]|nr:putative RNA methyltransferase TrmH, group 1 [Thiomonas sp. X19]
MDVKERMQTQDFIGGGVPATPDGSSACAQPLFVLVNTSHPGNVGAAARAIKTMGFAHLALVAPRYADVLQQPEALAFASGADDVLAATRISASLMDAAGDCGVLVALSSRVRDFGPPLHGPEWLPQLARQAAEQGRRVGFVFGSERYGLDNDTVYRCDALLSLPAYSQYASLNLAQAVQIVAWEWRKAVGAFNLPSGPPAEVAATQAEVQGLLDHAERALVALGYLDPAAPKKLLPRLARLATRAQLTQQEVHILRGICKAWLERLAIERPQAAAMQRLPPEGDEKTRG